MSEKIYVGNDHKLTVDQLRDTDGQYINLATVEATVTDSEGNEVEGQTWPLNLSYVEDSNGKYEGILDDAMELQADENYTLIIDVSDGSSVGHWELEVMAVIRNKWE